MPKGKPEIFVSYKWGGESEAIVDQIDEAFENRGVTIVRDKRDAQYKASIEQFMKRIGKGKFVIVVISKEYLEARNCMFELIKISEASNFYDRIYPIVLGNSKIYNVIDRLDYINYWDEKVSQLDAKIKTIQTGIDILSFQQELQLFGDIRKSFDSITKVLSDLNALTPEMHAESEFQEIFDAIHNSIKAEGGTFMSGVKLGHQLYLKCNRKKQRLQFHKSFETNIAKKCKVQFFAMCCQEGDAPDVMIERFRAELIQQHLKGNLYYKRIFHTVESDSVENNMEELKYELANKFEMKSFDLEPSELSKTIKDKKLNAAIVSHQLTVKNWDDIAKKTIKNLVHDFWHQVPAGEEDPHFILFFNFILSDFESGGLFSWFKKNPLTKVKGEIGTLLKTNCQHPMVVLDDPPRITAEDVREWAKTNNLYTLMPSVIDDLIKNVFSEGKEVFMQDVIGPLEEVIKKFTAMHSA